MDEEPRAVGERAVMCETCGVEADELLKHRSWWLCFECKTKNRLPSTREAKRAELGWWFT